VTLGFCLYLHFVRCIISGWESGTWELAHVRLCVYIYCICVGRCVYTSQKSVNYVVLIFSIQIFLLLEFLAIEV
jgi:hypothetical protein